MGGEDAAIEPASVDDVEALADQWIALAAEQREFGSHLRAGANREAMRMMLAARAAEDRALVAREEGIVGFVTFDLAEGSLVEDAQRGLIENLYVVPPARDRGVGSALLSAAETALADAGADVIAIEAMADNEAARRLYRRRGYEPRRISYERPAGSDNDTRDGD
ncbi:MAG: GNAT family N-acetyltransferase [Halobacteriales archaeon]